MPERDVKRKLLHFLVEKVSVTAYVVCLVVLVLVFGILYAYLTPIEQGFYLNDEKQKDALWYSHLFNGIYFSVVTISSLGYGDFRPVGVSKILTSLEVLIGVAILGIIIAKLTSRRVEFRISRLSRSNIEAYLEDQASKIYDLGSSLSVMLEDVGDRYSNTPVPTTHTSEIKRAASKSELDDIKRFSVLLEDVRIQYQKLREYFAEEIESDDFFQVAPSKSLLRVADVAERTAFFLMQVLMALPIRYKSKWLPERHRTQIASIVKDLKEVCHSMENSTTGLHAEESVIKLRAVCANLPRSYYQDPFRPDEMQPSQEPPAEGTVPSEDAEFVGS